MVDMSVDLILLEAEKQSGCQKQGKESDAHMFNKLMYIGKLDSVK